MSISIKRYVDVTSGVGGASVVPRRSLGMRLFTRNEAIPLGAVVTTTQLSDVQDLFGQSSNEYKVASNYFGFVSKTINTPKLLSFVRLDADNVTPAAVYGSGMPSVTGAAVPAGKMVAVFGDVKISINFPVVGDSSSTIATYATALQAALRALPPVNVSFEPFVDCIVTPNFNDNSLVVKLADATLATTGAEEFYFTADTPDGGAYDPATDAAAALGLDRSTATSQIARKASVPPIDPAVVFSTQIAESVEEDDNFGSFGIVPLAGQFNNASLTAAQITNIAAWNHAQNNKFMFLVGVTAASFQAVYDQCKNYSGFGITLVSSVAPVNPLDICPELGPGAVFGAIDFSNPSASQNFMFYQFASYTPTVTSNKDADKYDAVRVNYIGRTQTAGQKLAFYQRGSLQGNAQAATDMAVYTGEVWLKDAIVSTCLNGLLALPSISADREGRTTVLALIQGPVDEALENGVISIGKSLDNVQKAYISSITGNTAAWRQVEEKGYWLDAEVKSSVGSSGNTEYYIEYLLLYGKNDQIRKIVGRDIMI